MKQIAIIIGTRPEIIKTAPVIKKCIKFRVPFFIIHTGQHYSENMDRIFFDQLNLPKPEIRINVGSGSHGEQTGRCLERLEKILLEKKPEKILVQGDTNTVIAGALAASKLSIKIGHIEAGLRSYDRSMPEEINRVIADHLSHYLFAPTCVSKENLKKEGIVKNVFVTGNTIVEALKENSSIAEEKIGDKILRKLEIENNRYFLLTLHRQENVDNRDRLKEIFLGINKIIEKFKLPVIFPAHPRTVKNICKFNLINLLKKIKTIEPVGYFEFLVLEKNAFVILTDSGGLQEEACILKVPCITLRENTERPETLYAGSNILAGWRSKDILNSVVKMANTKRRWRQPFGDGKTSEKILKIITGA
ncbi:MAG: UDP-N-acetylglucosamine 2-epimerase (non-hydrolyzing) [bacterium]|nr:UDP-N-acetylglucosamine 2-epimerase (non-hydrolyzing) [bacterium]